MQVRVLHYIIDYNVYTEGFELQITKLYYTMLEYSFRNKLSFFPVRI